MLRKNLHIAQILSLDVVLGAVISSMFVASFMGVKVPPSHLSAMAIAVWLIYTADHLSDAKTVSHPASTVRHRFHQKYFQPIAFGGVFVAVLGLYNITFLPFTLVLWGALISLLVSLYFILIRLLPKRVLFHKELMIALLYVAGIFLAPLHQLQFIIQTPELLLMAQYFLLALTNVLLISWYEYDTDLADGHQSFVITVGLTTGIRSIHFCMAIFYITMLTVFFALPDFQEALPYQFVLLLMGISLHMIAVKQEFFAADERYRWAADAVFCYPVIYLLIY